MKKFLLSSVAVLGLVAAGAASAADLPARKGPVVAPVYAPVFTWTGFYVGANAGYGWGSVKQSPAIGLPDTDGFVGGGQIGYNWQMGQAVFGIEADFNGADLRSSAINVLGDSASSRVDWFGTVRGRVGFAADRFMPYVTGGLAYGSVKTTIAFPRFGQVFGNDDVQVGYTLGAGLEYAFTNNLSARVEYSYVDLGRSSVTGLPGVKVGADFHTVRAGLNYRF